MIRLKVMPDYECFPLWDEGALPENNPNLDPRKLPLSQCLVDDLLAWAGQFDATLKRDDPAASGFSTAAEDRRFQDEGRQLAKRVADELGSSAIVRYWFDTDRSRL